MNEGTERDVTTSSKEKSKNYKCNVAKECWNECKHWAAAFPRT